MRVSLLVATVTGVLLAALVPATSAVATGSAADGSYCAVDVSQSDTLTCAATEADLAVLWAGSSRARATQLLITCLYDNANYDTTAGLLEIYATSDCTATGSNIDWRLSDLGAWRHRVSSIQRFGNCTTRLWSPTTFDRLSQQHRPARRRRLRRHRLQRQSPLRTVRLTA